MTLTAGTRLGPYEILSPLGAGGMGEVYRAKDTRLGRDVAIKVLPETVAQDAARLARFEREARALAALNHPGIVTIFSVEESGGTRFLAMELVEGDSLDEVIASGGLPLPQFFEIATPLAEALSAAHERGIVHRDLKPGNVMVTHEGRVKVLDFGLARVEAADSDPNLTSTPTESRAANLTGEGQVFGTVAYMSPEQARGGKVDARSDVFSLGILLYEMLAGERPFQGESAVDLITSILRDRARSVTDLRADAPPHLARILRRCLEKDPRDRYQTSRDVYNELKELKAETSSADPSVSPLRSEAGASARTPSGPVRAEESFWIAVLPFKYGGTDASLAALAEGLSEEIGTGLSRFRYLSVVASASAARRKAEEEDGRALAARLGARYQVEGSIRGGGSAVRVSAQLVDVQTGAQLWSETFGRDLQASSVLEAQDDVAARIVATVADSYGVLVHSIRSATRQKDDVHLTPGEWQFQYFAYREQITPVAHAELKSRLERAVERDGRQSDLWACLAQLHVDAYAFGFAGDANSLDRALAAARRAVELDRANQFALVALAQTHFFRQDLAAFGPAAERAMALNPLNTDAIGILGLQIVHTGEFERGTAIVRRAMELNANHAGWMHFAPLWDHFHRGEYEQALERANRVDVPGLFWPYLVMASACGHLGRRAEAAAAVRDLLALDPEFAAHARSNVGTWHFASGLMEPILEGLRKAGLSIPETDGSFGSAARTGAAARPPSGPAGSDEGFRVAVLPFKYAGPDASLTALAEGLTAEIVTGLSRFSYLRVSSSAGDHSAGKSAAARYVIEGSLRQAGTRLRLAVQLVDTNSGANLWAENYERAFAPEAAFELQDDLVPRIVATVGDQYGALVHSMSESLRGRSADQYSAHEAVLRAFGYWERVTPDEHREVREILEAAVARAPGHGDSLAALSLIYGHEYVFGYNRKPDPLGRARAAAQRAVAAAPTNHFAHCALASAFFFQKDFLAFRPAAERALALNPMDSSSTALLGTMMTYACDWEYGVRLVERAKQINPHHPGWFHYVALTGAYRRGDYRGALDILAKINMPGYHWPHVLRAAIYGQLGERERADAALRDLHDLLPNFSATAREEFGKWYDAELSEHLLDGLRKAGMEIPPDNAASDAQRLARPSPTDSGAVRADEGFWVAVLPFKYSGADASLKALADGLTEEIVTGLSRFSYLRVISLSSSRRFSTDGTDVRAVGKDLGARYVMEGSLRQAGTALRVSVQLIDAVSGAHLWAETYNRVLQPDAIFDLQDDVVRRIVSTVADTHGILPHSMSEALRGKSPDELTPYEAVLRGLSQVISVSAEGHASVRAGLERAVQEAPGYADAWALLSNMCREEYAHGFNPKPDPLGRALAAARRAVEIAPSNHLAHHALASALFLRRELPAFRSAAERAVALNPMDGFTTAYLASLVAYSGDWERGCAMAKQARDLNPHHPSWYWFSDCFDAYRRGDYRAARDIARKIQMPGFWRMNLALAVAHGQLGEQDAAAGALRALLAAKPEFASHAREELLKWWNADFVEHLMDGLRKAGLGVSDAPSGAPSKPAPEVSVAVLPFADMSPAKDQEYLCEGMAEEIMNALVRIEGIRVASRTSAFRARAQQKELADVARVLNVGHVLEGSVRTSGGRLRVTAQLTDVASGYQLWSERFDRDAADIFAVQDEIAAGVVDAVKARLAPGARAVAARAQPANVEAYRCYLRGRHFRGKEHLAAALEAFEEAVRLDPTYAPAWTSLAEGTVLASVFGVIPARVACETARKALATAKRLQGDSAEGLHVEGFVAWIERRWDAMEAAWRRALELQPDHVLALASFGIVLCTRGRLDEALPLLERARQADPLASFPYALTGAGLLSCRRASEALRYLEDALSLEKDDATALDNSGMANVALGRFDEGIAHLEHAVAVTQRGAHFLGTLGWALATAGRKDEARAILAELRARPPEAPAVVSEAWLLGALGEVDAAFEVIARADEERHAYLYFTGLPAFDPLRSDPRFAALLERLELPAA